MQVVGVDFGTTNVRISAWDSDGDLPPEPKMIGDPTATTMPAVVALRRQLGGEISVIVGEQADSLVNVENEIEVIRNIKRCALSDDDYVNWHLDVRNAHEDNANKWPPTWWDKNKRCIHVWGQEFPVWDLIEAILAEGFRRADIGGEFRWRAGCPVHANLSYREGLAQTLDKVTGQNNRNRVAQIIEEPILFLTLAHKIMGLDPSTRLNGSFLVYDLGGGSFDSALVEIKSDSHEMVVYGADGHPLLGGSDIDEELKESCSYTVQPDVLRKAKERLSPSNPSEPLGDGTVITLDNLNEAESKLRVVKKSLMAMRDAYISAKVLWKRGDGEDDPPVGEILSRNENGTVRLVWQLMWDDLAANVDKIVLFGGPTRSPNIFQQLSDRFGPEKLITASKLLPVLTGTPDLELVGISMGACYSYQDSYSPLYVNRLPVQVKLEDLESGEMVEYEPFRNFTFPPNPFDGFFSKELTGTTAAIRSFTYPERYQLTITYPDGLVLGQKFVDESINPRLIGHTLKLVIDRYGRVGVEQTPLESDVFTQDRKRYLIFQDTPWQSEEQRQALQQLFEQEKRYEEERQSSGLANVNRLPWQYPQP